MKRVELTKDQELAIAQFVFAHQNETLIASEVRNCMDALVKAKLMHRNKYYRLINKITLDTIVYVEEILYNNIPKEQGKEIMERYKKGKLV